MLPNLDILRALAVLIVLVAHVQAFVAADQLAGFWVVDHEHLGRWGVLMFFVHTSFVLMQSLERTRWDGWRTALHFYVRRGFRLYPLSIAMVLGMVLIGAPQMPLDAYRWIGWKHLASNLALTNNLTFSPFVLAPLWSLPFEMQMYLVLPALYVIAVSRGAVSRLGLLWIVAAVLATVVTPEVVYRAKFLQFVPCFLGGVTGYALSRSVRTPRVPAWLWPVWLFAVWLGYAVLNPGRDGWVPCLLLGLSIPLFRQFSSTAITRPAEAIAKYSYSIYLVHIPLLWLLCVKLTWPAPLRWAAFAVAMIVVPVALYHGIERPLITLGSRCANTLTARRRVEPVAPAQPAFS